MKIAIIRGQRLNQWEMQNFEPLALTHDVTAIGADQGFHPTKSIRLPIQRLPSAPRRSFARRVTDKLKVTKRTPLPPDTLFGLENTLSGFGIAHAAETFLSFSEQAVRAKLNHGTKVVLTCWETLPYSNDLQDRTKRRTFVRENTDLFLPTTQRAARALEIEGVPSERIRVIMPGVDTARFRPGPRSLDLLKQYRLDGTELIVLFIGRLTGEKGIRELMVAFALLLRQLPPSLAQRCRLLLAGQGLLQDDVPRFAGLLGVAEQVRVVGGLDYMEIHLLHQLADVFVLPSVPWSDWEEQFGMVLAEAMACGKPVVSTDAGGVPEVIGKAGLLVKPLEPAELGDALLRLITDEDFRGELGQKARQRAVMFLDAKKTAAEFAEAYATLDVSSSKPSFSIRPGSPVVNR